MANIENYHRQPCANCGHTDMHGEVSGCVHVQGGAWCDCAAYVEPAQTRVARTIPSRNTDPGTAQAAPTYLVKANNQRGRLLKAFSLLKDATDEEAMEKAEGVTPFSEYAKRCSELRDAHLIEPTGGARKGQSGIPRLVSRITDQGRAIASNL